MGAYCQFCGRRCFVVRTLPDGSWSGCMATCAAGMEHDRKSLGHDHTTAVNPAAKPEHQIVVVFDIAADTREQAAAVLARIFQRDGLVATISQPGTVESWWFPEPDLKHVDHNDNPPGRLVLEDDLPAGVFVEDDAEDDPTIWLATDNPERPQALLSHCAFARLVGGDDQALPLWHRLTAGLPTAPPVGECGYCGKRTDEWPARECEEPEQHATATYDCDCGETVTIAEAIARPEQHRRCNLIGADR